VRRKKEEEDLVFAGRVTGQEENRPPSGLRKGNEKEWEEMGCPGKEKVGHRGIGSRVREGAQGVFFSFSNFSPCETVLQFDLKTSSN
jgi:hypothetical protein